MTAGDAVPRGAVAVVGARDGDLWTYLLFDNLSRFGPDRSIWPVSQSREFVRGRAAYRTVEQLPGRPEVVVLAVSADRALPLVEAAVASEVPHVVLISSGFAERGDTTGEGLQERLVRVAAGGRSRIYGPNGVGFADLAAGLCPLGAPMPPGLAAGNVSVISQSGSITTSILAGLVEDGTGVDWCVSIGNGACFDAVDAIEASLDRPETRVITGYIESFGAGGRGRLERALERAESEGVAIVLVRGGTTTRGAQVTKSHTAAMTSPRRLVGEVLDRHGVIVVPDVEALVRTAAIVSYEQRRGTASYRSGGVAVIETSGGAAAVLADMMDAQGVRLAELSQGTVATLGSCAPPGAFVSNPIDLTASPKPFEEVTEAFRRVYEDPDVGWIVIPFALTFPMADDGRTVHRVALERYAQLAAETATKTLISTLTVHDWTDWAMEFRAKHPEVLVLRGVTSTVGALGRLVVPLTNGVPDHAEDDDAVARGVPDPATARQLLQSAGIAVPAGRFFGSAEVAALAELRGELSFPVVVKLVADGLLHKARIGGVVVGCGSPAEAMESAERILSSARAHGVHPTGVLVEEMVAGPEIFVSFDRDPWYGPFLLIAPGGGDVERSRTSALCPLPVTDDQLWTVLKDNAAAWGFRAATEEMVDFLRKVAEQFLEGPLARWRTVELNPVILTAEGPRPVDAVMVPREAL